MSGPLIIRADWDAEAGVWVAVGADCPLVAEAPSIEALRAKLPGMIEDMVEERMIDGPPSTVEIIAYARDVFPRAA